MGPVLQSSAFGTRLGGIKLETDGQTTWDGVRNALARKNLRAMRLGDSCLFYHSSCKDVGVVGEVAVVREAYPDPADEKWAVVDVRFTERWRKVVPLATLRQHATGALAGLALLSQSRLSVVPVSAQHFAFIRSLRDSDA